MRLLKQSTSVDVPIGPFVDSTDGFTAETALTLTQPDIRLKKNGAAWAQKAAAQTLSHEENGYYEVTLDATDTGTLGLLRLAVNETGALPIFEDFMVMPANVWDSLFGADALQVHAVEISAALITATALANDCITAAKIAPAAIDEATFAADTAKYQAKVWLFDDNGGSTDRYVTVWYKNGEPIVAGITTPLIQVFAISDGTDLIASTAMTQIGATGTYRKDEATNRIVAGAGYIAKVTATIDSAARTWYQPVGRDS